MEASKLKKGYISTFIYSTIFCFIMLCIIIYPVQSVEAASNGLKLWFNVVCPALLPFFICIDILTGLGIVSLLGAIFRSVMLPVFKVPGEASFGFMMSIASGYPVGAKITAKLRQDRMCTRLQGQRMLNLCSTSGPLFIIGAVATGMLRDARLGALLAVTHYLSALTVGYFMRFYGRDASIPKYSSSVNPIREMFIYRKKDGRTIGALMGDSVKNGVNLILMIGGYIILFSVIAAALKLSGLLDSISAVVCSLLPFLHIDKQTVSSALIGILEVTNGINECAKLSLPLIGKCSLVSFMIGFGGLSVNAQVLSIIADTDLRFGFYLFVKLFQGITAAIYTYFMFNFFDALQTISASHIFSKSLYLYKQPVFGEVFACTAVNIAYILLGIAVLAAGAALYKNKQKSFG